MIRTDNGEVIEGEVSQQQWRELALSTGERVFVRPKSLRVFPEPVEYGQDKMTVTHPQRTLKVLTASDPTALALSIRASCLVFEDEKSKALLALVERIAQSQATALIIGETGTGKELIARHIHELSARRMGPFVAVNCAAITESLMESELFGHERGAFTGAVMAKAGWFETADGGSLFLDEIGDLPLALQAKLLRVIQEREIVRIGSRQS